MTQQRITQIKQDDPRLTLRLPVEIGERLETVAEANFRNLNAEILAAIDGYTTAKHSKTPPTPYKRGNPVAITKPRIPPALHERIKGMAAEHGRSLNSELCAAILWHLKREDS